MRFAMFLAALAALWSQPACAAYFYIGGPGIAVFNDETRPPERTFLRAILHYGDYLNRDNPHADYIEYTLFRDHQPRLAQGVFLMGDPTAPLSILLDTRALLGTWAYGNETTSFRASGLIIGSGVPEPATWSMLALGFGVMGWAMRRQRQQRKLSYAF